jgi:hypothetical protein
MLTAATFEPSDFHSADPAAMTEIQIGASYLGATHRSMLCVVVGGQDHEVDLPVWAVSACLKVSNEMTGRNGTIVPDDPVERARVERAFALLAPTAQGVPLSRAPLAGFQDEVLVVPVLELFERDVARDVTTQVGALLAAFATGSPQAPPAHAAPLVMAASEALGTKGLGQLHATLWALQNAEAPVAVISHDEASVADAFGLGITTSLRPGSAVQYRSVPNMVWEVVRTSREATEVGGRVVLVNASGRYLTVDALRCQQSDISTPYHPVAPDALLNVANGLKVVGAAKGAGIRYGQAVLMDSPGTLLEGHCSFIDVVPRLLRSTRWGVWAPSEQAVASHSANLAPPMLRDFAWGPAPVSAIATAMDQLQQRFGVGDRIDSQNWAMARNIAYSAMYYNASPSYHLRFTDTDHPMHLRLSIADPPTEVDPTMVTDYFARFDLLPIGTIVRLLFAALLEAFDPNVPDQQASEILQIFLDVDHAERPGSATGGKSVTSMRKDLSRLLWSRVATDWSKRAAVERAVAKDPAIVYCDFSCRMLAFTASAWVVHDQHGRHVAAVEDGDDTKPVKDGTRLVPGIQVLLVDQTVYSHVLGYDQTPRTLLLTQPPPRRADLLRAVQQVSRAFRASRDVSVLILLTRSPSDSGFKTLASTVDIDSFLGGGSKVVSKPTTAWATGRAASSDVELRITQFASSELSGRIGSVVGAMTAEVADWTSLLKTARGLPEWALFHARLSSIEGPGDLDKLPLDELKLENVPSIDRVRQALSRQALSRQRRNAPLVAYPVRPVSHPPALAPQTKAFVADTQWKKAKDTSGRVYYYNRAGESHWKLPNAPVAVEGTVGEAAVEVDTAAKGSRLMRFMGGASNSVASSVSKLAKHTGRLLGRQADDQFHDTEDPEMQFRRDQQRQRADLQENVPKPQRFMDTQQPQAELRRQRVGRSAAISKMIE